MTKPDSPSTHSRAKTPDDYRALAKRRGFRWLGSPVPDTRTKTQWQCSQRHHWQATYNSIQQGKGCPVCAHHSRKTPADYRVLAKARGLKWLGPEVHRVDIKTTWQCAKGHRWQSMYRTIQKRGGCPVCAGKLPKTSADYYALARQQGLRWIGPLVPNVATKTTWQCAKGHHWQAKYNSVRQGHGCPICSDDAQSLALDGNDPRFGGRLFGEGSAATPMNNHDRRAGRSTREMAARQYKARRWFVLVTTGVALLTLLLASNIKVAGAGVVGIFGLLILVRFLTDYMDVKARRLRKEERRAVRGAKAEERIGTALDDLGEDYFVLHDVSSLYGNIDHIVISKHGGVFLIETKAHGGRVYVSNGQLLVNGHEPEKDFIAQALKNTYWLRDRICDEINVKIWITPVVVFTNAFVERTAPIKGVNIINMRYLPNVLQRSNTGVQNLAAWENRERIQEALYATSGDEV